MKKCEKQSGLEVNFVIPVEFKRSTKQKTDSY